jgi:transposase
LTAQRVQRLAAEAAELRAELDRLVAAVAPWLLELPGVGPISAAQVLVCSSHAGRLRDDPTTRTYAARRRSDARAFATSAGALVLPYGSSCVVRSWLLGVVARR